MLIESPCYKDLIWDTIRIFIYFDKPLLSYSLVGIFMSIAHLYILIITDKLRL